MARGGYRPGAGRPRKTDAKTDTCDTVKISDDGGSDVVKESRTPLEYMLAVMNDPSADAARRDRMAIAAAPFVHAKPGEGGKKEAKAEAAQKVAAGKFAAGAPPKLVVNNA